MSDIWPDGTTEDDAQALDELDAAGIGEGDFGGEENGVPAEAIFAFECLEAAAAGFPPSEPA